MRLAALCVRIWKRHAATPAPTFAAISVYLALVYVILPALHLQENSSAMNKLLNTPLWFRLILVLRTAITEEIITAPMYQQSH